MLHLLLQIDFRGLQAIQSKNTSQLVQNYLREGFFTGRGRGSFAWLLEDDGKSRASHMAIRSLA